MQRNFIFLACLLLYCAQTRAQQYPFVYYSPKDGLINSRVKNIRQDSRGFLYFITQGGLSVYDGSRFTNYSMNNGLANDVVNDVIEMAPDSLLVATNVNAINTLVHGVAGVFKTSDNFCPVINRFYKSGNTLYAAADEGLFLLSGNRFVGIPLIDKERKESGQYLDRIEEWKNFLLLIPWNGDLKEKLIIYDTIKKLVVATETQQIVHSVAVDKQGMIWISTREGIGNLDTASLKKGKIAINEHERGLEFLPKLKNYLTSFDREGNKWFFNREVIYRLSPEGEVQRISSKQGLKIKNTTSILIDREGILWIATDGYGVAKLTNSGVEILNAFNNTPAAIRGIAQDNDITWIANAADNSVYRVTKYSTAAFSIRLSLANIIEICTNKEKLYLLTSDTIFCIPDKNDAAAYFHPEIIFTEPGSRLGNANVDVNGNIIVQVNKGDTLFYTYVISNRKVIYQFPTRLLGDQSALDRSGRLWLITRSSQLLLFSLHPETPSHYLQLLKDYSKDFPHLDPRSIMIDNNNDVWIGTRYRGIIHLKLDGIKIDSINQFNTAVGLTDNFVYTLACDSSGNIWAGTQTGLDKLFLKDHHYIIGNVSRNNNLFQPIHQIVVTKDNTVWALSDEGTVLKISPTTFNSLLAPPQLVIREIKVDNRLIASPTKQFSFNQKNFSFRVAAPSFLDEQSIRYSYLLEGSGNDSWSEPANQSVFNFYNLSPAHYTLKVKCDFPQERYASQIISYSFDINPPWWQTWWFRLTAILSIIGFFFVIIRFYFKRKLERTRAILEKQQAIEKERTRIATDMHDDLGAGLSRIKFLSETIGIKKQKHESVGDEINKIREYSHEMIARMGEIVWALNEKNDSLSDLLSFTRSYAVEYLSQSGIRCEVEAPDTFPTDFVSGEFRRNIYLVVKEALHNVVKHAQASEVALKIKTNQQLEICIQDDGIGFNRSSTRPFSNGLANMEKRIAEIGGRLTISSDMGTTIYIAAPLK